jgi:hypothetical protein
VIGEHLPELQAFIRRARLACSAAGEGDVLHNSCSCVGGGSKPKFKCATPLACLSASVSADGAMHNVSGWPGGWLAGLRIARHAAR